MTKGVVHTFGQHMEGVRQSQEGLVHRDSGEALDHRCVRRQEELLDRLAARDRGKEHAVEQAKHVSGTQAEYERSSRRYGGISSA